MKSACGHRPTYGHLSPPLPTIGASWLALEPRIMFDGAAPATVDTVAAAQLAQSQAESAISPDDVTTSDTPPMAPTGEPQFSSGDQALFDALAAYDTSAARQEIVFLSPSVRDYQKLLDGISPNVEVFVLDPTRDGVEQMAEVLAGRTGIDAIHAISHGSEGSLDLGTARLTLDSMAGEHADDLAVIAQTLSENADLLIYGCNFGQGDQGAEAAVKLAQLTGADVAASTDDTGHASLGGNWGFEFSAGPIETRQIVTRDVQQNWTHLLATEDVRDNFSSVSYSNNDGTRSWTTSWVESEGGGAGPGAGAIQVTGGALFIDAGLGTVGNNIYREANLTGALSATLTYSYTASLGVGGAIQVQISDDGGASYTTLETYTPLLPLSGSGNFDVSAYISANTRIRFEVTGALLLNNIQFDDIQISYFTNDPPVVDLNGGGAGNDVTTAFTEQTPVVIAPSGTLTDVDSTNLTAVTMTLTARPDGNAVESLTLNAAATTAASGAGLTVTYTASAGVLSITGSATTAVYQTILQGILYNNTSDTPTTSNRSITVVANDGALPSAARIATITMTLVNDPSVITSNGGGATAAVTAAENQTAVTTVTSADVDGGAPSYTIVGGADQARFTLDSVTGVLTFLTAPDFETPTDAGGNNVYDVTVQVSDGNGGTDTQALSVTVTDVDEFDVGAISDTNAAANAVNENAANGTAVGIIAAASDADATTNTVTYTLDDSAGGRFAIDGATGVVTVAGSLDREAAASHNITVRATSADGSFSIEAFTIGVQDVNDNAPVIPTGQTFGIPENSVNGIVVGTALATDVDSVGTLQSWTIIGGTGATAFAINAASGAITVADTTQLNFEATPSFTLQLTVSDGTNTSAMQTVTIDLSNVNEAPAGTDNTVSTNEDVPYIFAAGDFGFTDVDAGDTMSALRIDALPAAGTLTLSGVAVSATDVISVADISAGNLVFTPALNANGSGYASFTFSVRDVGGLYDPTPNTMTMDVTAVNDAPTTNDVSAGGAEDAASIAITLTGADVDGTVASFALSSLPANGTLYTDAGLTTPAATGVDYAAGGNALTLYFAPTADWNGVTTFQYAAKDTGGLADVSPATATLTVTAVNDAPMNTVPGAQTVAEDTALSLSGLSVTDVDDNLSMVQLSVLNGAVTVTLSGGATISAGANGSNTLTLSGSQVDVNATLASLIYQGNLNYTGPDTLTVLSTDTNAITDSDTVAITVSAVNDAPTNLGSLPPDVSVTEDVLGNVDLSLLDLSDVDAGAGNLTVTLSTATGGNLSATSGGGVTGGGSGTGVLTLTGTQANLNTYLNNAANVQYLHGTANTNGDNADTITVQVTDNGNTGSDEGGTITLGIVNVDITAVNDPPTLTALGDQTIPEDGTTGPLAFTVGDVETAAGSLTVTATSSNQTLIPDGNLTLVDLGGGNWTIAAVSAPNQNGGPVTITVTVSDGTTSTNETFDVTITPVNDAPVLAVNTGSTVARGGTDTITIAELQITDIDNTPGQLTYTVTVGPVNGQLELTTAPGLAISSFTQAQIDAGQVVYVHNGSFTAGDGFTFTVSDGAGGNIGATTFGITVTPVNSVPTLAANAGSTVIQGLTDVITLGELRVTDADNSTGQLIYTITTAPINGRLELTTAPGVAVTTFTQADIDAGRLVFVHNGAVSTSDSFTFTVSDGAGGTIGATTFTFTVAPFVPPPGGGGGTGGGGSTGGSGTGSGAGSGTGSGSSNNAVLTLPIQPPSVLISTEVSVEDVLVKDLSAKDVSVVGATYELLPRAVIANPTFAGTEQPDTAIQESEQLSLPVKNVLAVGHNLAERLTRLADDLERGIQEREYQTHLIGRLASLFGMALSAGFVAWILRGGSLVASFLGSMPAWRHFDPLPVLEMGEGDGRRRDRKMHEEAEGEKMLLPANPNSERRGS